MRIFSNFKDLNIFLKNKSIFFSCVFFLFSVISSVESFAQSTSFSNVIVKGNQRIETNTILSIAGLKVGESYNSAQINESLIRLKSSTNFKNVNINIDETTLFIIVQENPTINSINFEGNVFLKDENLLELISITSRQAVSISKIEKDAEKIANSYLSSGRISAQVTPKLINKKDNRVDVIFEIEEGKISEIEKISFIGNKGFSEARLRGVISTKQAGIFRSFLKSDTFIKDRLDYDKQLLESFYINRGFINFEVVNMATSLTREKDAFLINITLKEGQKYTYGKINFKSTEGYVDLAEINALNKIKVGSNYDPRKITNLIDEIYDNLSKSNINFININPVINVNNQDLTVDVSLNLIKSQKLFVERIEIEGNSTTLDAIIRHKFNFIEGDPFDKIKTQKAVDRIRGLGFFSKVDFTTREGSSPEKIILKVSLVEKPTGSLGLGAGYNSSDGTVFNFNINERNFIGKGQTVDLAFSNSSIEKQLTLGLEEPAFLGRNLLIGISLGTKNKTPYSVPLTTTSTFFAPKIRFPLTSDSSLTAIYRYDEDEIKLSSSSIATSSLISADVGNETKSGIIFKYNLDKTNSILTPTSGFKLNINQEINGISGDINYSKITAEIKSYSSLMSGDIIVSSSINSGAIIGSDANVLNRFSLGGDMLRGFRNYGVGPIDNSYTGSDSNGDPLGGNMFTVINLETSFPIGVPEEYGVFGGIFVGAGSVWDLDNKLSGSTLIDDSAKIRAAAGVSLFWDTVIGPLRFNFSRPIFKEEHDITENFRFTVDTRF